MMKQNYIIGATIVVIVIGIIFLYLSHKPVEKFDISTEPVVEDIPYQVLKNVDNCLERQDIINPTQYGGLNPKSNANLTLVDFINTYGTGENYNGYDTADVTSRRYCDLVYTINNEYFTDRWVSGGECELAIKKECENLFPKAPKKAYF